jgi:ubiquinone biosynthesis UbiH/UbiF/VisC/COQ6 family hydroxylase
MNIASAPTPAGRQVVRADVLIAGGGLVGATLALLLARDARIDATRVVIVEPHLVQPPARDAPSGLRVSAISPANRERLTRLGVWQRLDAQRTQSIQRMAVWSGAVPPDSPDVLHFDAAESGVAELGVMVENAALQGALLRACVEAGMHVVTDRLQALQIDAAGAHAQLTGQGEVHAELVVGADGAASVVRRLLALPAEAHSYGQQGMVATIDAARAHDGTAYQRFLDTGPLALLPMPRNQCSIVWSATDARAAQWLALPATQFEEELTAASAGVLGRLTLASERAAFPLQRLDVQRYVASRVALVGDAAHVIHPLAGQGVNQGMEDAAALASHLAKRPARESPGALSALRSYERERRAGNAVVGGAIHGIDGLFTDAGPISALAGRAALALAARSPLVRRLLVRQAAAGRSSPRR